MSFYLLIILCLHPVVFILSAGGKPAIAKPGCKSLCGNVSLPYPFGIGLGCFLNPWYEINCTSSSTPSPLLKSLNLELKQIDLTPTTGQPMASVSIPLSLTETWSTVYIPLSLTLHGSRLRSGSAVLLAGCSTVCVQEGFQLSKTCYGIECCQTTIPSLLDFYKINFTLNLPSSTTAIRQGL